MFRTTLIVILFVVALGLFMLSAWGIVGAIMFHTVLPAPVITIAVAIVSFFITPLLMTPFGGDINKSELGNYIDNFKFWLAYLCPIAIVIICIFFMVQ